VAEALGEADLGKRTCGAAAELHVRLAEAAVHRDPRWNGLDLAGQAKSRRPSLAPAIGEERRKRPF